MDILSTAIRRIFVRNTDNTISNLTRNSLIGLTEYNPIKPSLRRLIFNVIIFSLLNYILIKIFLLIGFIVLAFATPFFFLGTIIKPLFSKFIYGRQQESINQIDRRYKTGTRTVGYRFGKDKTIKIDFSKKEILFSRLEGILKLLLGLFFIYLVYSEFNSTEYKINKIQNETLLKYFKVNDTILSVRKEIDVCIKIKEKISKYKKDYSNISFKKVFVNNSKELGIFINIDSFAGYGETYIAFKPFIQKDTLFKFDDTQKRFDDKLYIKSSDITITPYNFEKQQIH